MVSCESNMASIMFFYTTLSSYLNFNECVQGWIASDLFFLYMYMSDFKIIVKSGILSNHSFLHKQLQTNWAQGNKRIDYDDL